jgi:hypothetical protein
MPAKIAAWGSCKKENSRIRKVLRRHQESEEIGMKLRVTRTSKKAKTPHQIHRRKETKARAFSIELYKPMYEYSPCNGTFVKI